MHREERVEDADTGDHTSNDHGLKHAGGSRDFGWSERIMDRIFPAPDLSEHVSFRRTKLSLLTIGVAVVLVANVCYLGFATPPEGPQMPLIIFDGQGEDIESANITNPGSMLDLLLNKTYDYDTGELDVSRLSLDEYAALFTTINPDDFCGNSLLTAFRVLNGLAFAIAMATIFLVAVVPVFVTKNNWDLHLARIGAIFMTFCILAFLAAFLLAGFVTIGMGSRTCDFDPTEVHGERKSRDIVSASAYATVGFACALVVVVLILAIKG